ncbi:low-density lipoprotein receptor-related protein 2-like [Mytilus trossulus]|uniref:low-density lipoprotein receptor-related protein 2-like n=1 Tax=Mytilus trossulus TaxID=6551 RepID=UPI00300591AE
MMRQSSFMLMVLIGLHTAKADACSDDQLKCHGSDQCYPQEKRCDGFADCGNSTDEYGCDACVDGAFHCSNEKKCIPSEWHCNGIDDCDGEDEKSCTACNSYAFLCASDKTCIRSNWVCDSWPDCWHGEDELGCQNDVCGDDEFKCFDPHFRYQKCVPQDKINNGMNDCGDCSDEAYRDNCINDGCGDNEFKCHKECIPIEKMRDGIDDCGDCSDEFFSDDCMNLECNNDEFLCTADRICIASDYVCDSYPACSDGKDDIGCPHDGCSDDEFKCNNTSPSLPKCVRAEKINDGTDDCGDCSDEAFRFGCVYGKPHPLQSLPGLPYLFPIPQRRARNLPNAHGQKKKKNEGTEQTVAHEQRGKIGEGTVLPVTRKQRRMKDEDTVHIAASGNTDIDAHRQVLRRGKSHLKDNLRNSLLRSKTDDRLTKRVLSRREMNKRKREKKSK